MTVIHGFWGWRIVLIPENPADLSAASISSGVWHFIPSMIVSNFSPVSSAPSDSLQIKKIPPFFSILAAWAKHFSSPGQK